MLTVEAREYGPNSTPGELEAIKARLYLIRPAVVMYREVPVPSPFQIGVFAEKLRAITADLPAYDMILDLTEAKPPGSSCRDALREMFATEHKLGRLAVFTGGNFIINSVAKLLLKSCGVRELKMCKDEAEALATLGAR